MNLNDLSLQKIEKQKRWFETYAYSHTNKYIYILGGGFQYFLFSPRTLGKWFNLTNMFQRGWFNHQLTPSASEAAAAGKSQNDLALYRFYLAYRHRMSPGGLGGEWPIGTGAQWRSYEYKLISDGNIYIWYMIYVFLEYLH